MTGTMSVLQGGPVNEIIVDTFSHLKGKNDMTINKTQNGTELIVALVGRLDTTTAPQLEAELNQSLDGVEKLVMDLAEMDYISSAGLRVLLSAHKKMTKQGGMTVRNVSEIVMDIFDVTGFADILKIEA